MVAAIRGDFCALFDLEMTATRSPANQNPQENFRSKLDECASRVKHTICMPRFDRLADSLLGSRSVVRGGFSIAIVLALILFGVISFLWMVGFQPVSHDALRVGKGNLSYNHTSAHRTNGGR